MKYVRQLTMNKLPLAALILVALTVPAMAGERHHCHHHSSHHFTHHGHFHHSFSHHWHFEYHHKSVTEASPDIEQSKSVICLPDELNHCGQ